MITKYIQLSKKEKKIYNAIMKSFPETSKQTAIMYALEGGVKFQFKYR